MFRIALWTQLLKNRFEDEEGAGLAEYALLLFVVAVAAATVISAFGEDIIAAFTGATNSLPSNAPPPPAGP